MGCAETAESSPAQSGLEYTRTKPLTSKGVNVKLSNRQTWIFKILRNYFDWLYQHDGFRASCPHIRPPYPHCSSLNFILLWYRDKWTSSTQRFHTIAASCGVPSNAILTRMSINISVSHLMYLPKKSCFFSLPSPFFATHVVMSSLIHVSIRPLSFQGPCSSEVIWLFLDPEALGRICSFLWLFVFCKHI